MLLSVTTFNIVNDWSLPFLIEKCKEFGIFGLEFRLDRGHGHGVEISLSKEERREIRERIEDSYLAVVGVGSSARFDVSGRDDLRKEIDLAKRSIELCAEIGGKTVRVYGNDVNKELGREQTTHQIGESLAELIEFGKQCGVEPLLEMHGEYNNWRLALAALNASGSPEAGLIYNSDDRDVIGGSVRNVYSRVRGAVKLVHLHDLTSGFPYAELLQLLKDDNYGGFISAELPASGDAERVLGYYAAMFKIMVSNLK